MNLYKKPMIYLSQHAHGFHGEFHD